MSLSDAFRAALLLAVSGLALAAPAQNLVRDGDVEAAPTGAYRPGDRIDGNWSAFNATGDANTWIVDGTEPFGPPISGTRDVFLLQSGVQQTLATTPNQTYAVSLDVTAPNTTNFLLSFGGTTLTVVVEASNAVTHLAFVADATASATRLGVSTDTFNHLDNVRVEAVPEPATWAALGLGAFAFLRRRRS